MAAQTFGTIARKVHADERLTPSDGLFLLQYPDRDAVCELADQARKRRVGDIVYFTSAVFIHPTNLCELSCPLCSYYAKPGMPSAWLLTPQDIEDRVRKHLPDGISEVHIVGGLWRECSLDYYQDVLQRLKTLEPSLHLKALSAVEYAYLARLHGISVAETLTRMQSWGMGSMPGGGAEILVEKIRKIIAPEKTPSAEFLSIHRTAHSLGVPTNVTMLFGHVEDNEDIITHLCRIRELQDETAGFKTFVPLQYSDDNNALGKRRHVLKPKDTKRIYAVSRLMLDNIADLKVLWNYVGVETAQEILSCGANDFGSTAHEEKISDAALDARQTMNVERMCSLIRATGRIPKHIHSGYDTKLDRPCCV